jgi:hypothetical protein
MRQFDSLAELDDAMKNLATLYPAGAGNKLWPHLVNMAYEEIRTLRKLYCPNMGQGAE